MHPVLFTIGSFRVPTFGVLLVLGLITAVYVIIRLGKREGLDPNRLLDFSTWLIITGLVGAKVLMIVSDWGEYRQNPGEIFSVATLEAAGVFYGGLIAATLFAVWYIRRRRLPLLKVFDVYAPAIAIGQCIGRLGCFAAGDDYGKPTHSFLGVVFTNPYTHELSGTPLNTPIHPVQLYESAVLLGIFGVLMWQFGRKRRDGEVFLSYIVLYAVARFILEFFRGDADRGFVFNGLLSTSQFIAILALVFAGFWAYYLYRSPAVPAFEKHERDKLPRPSAVSHVAGRAKAVRGR